MENKTCPNCGRESTDANFCPACGADLNEEVLYDTVAGESANQEDAGLSGEIVDSAENGKADKKIKLITASVALMLVVSLGLFGWYIYSGKNGGPADMALEDINGTFVTVDNASYFEFEIGETTIQVEDKAEESQAASDASALSDAAAASDGAKAKKSVTFDGTYKTGYTTDYVQTILAREYVTRNELGDDYDKYVKDNSLVMDDYLGFIKSKGVSMTELDAIDKELQLSVQRLQYDQEGYWKYNNETKTVVVYANDGVSEVASLVIKGDTIVDPVGFFAGEIPHKKTFNATLKYAEDGINETIIFYNDGNFIIKAEYEGQDEQYIAGTYVSDDEYVVMNINGQRAPHAKVNGGMASVVYKKKN